MGLPELQAHGTGYGNRYLKITTVDSYYSNPVFYIADQFFETTNVSTGPPTYPIVQSWGSFSKEGMERGREAQCVGELRLLAGVEIVPTSSIDRLSFADWARAISFLDAIVELYQWNALTTTQALIWKGYIVDVGAAKFAGGVWTVDLVLSNEQKSLASSSLGTVITEAGFGSAPISSLLAMEPTVYGRFDNTLFSGAIRNSPAFFGFPIHGYRGVTIDENLATVQIKHRLSKNDGASAAHTFAEPTADDPSTVGDLWIYDSGMGAYGLVDAASYSFVNDTSKLEVLVDSSPKVFFFIRPSLKGSENAAAFTDIHKLIDSDPTNYVESTTTDFKWAFECPEISVNGKVKSITIVVDFDNVHGTEQRKIRYGIWDIYKNAGAGYLNSISASSTPFIGASRRIRMLPAPRYQAKDFKAGGTGHAGSSTMPEFKSGRFVTRDAGDVNEANLQLKVEVEDIGGADAGFDQVRVYGIALVVEVDYPTVPRSKSNTWMGPGWSEYYLGRAHGEERRWLEKFRERNDTNGRTPAAVRSDAVKRLVGTDFFARGIAQKDDVSGTVTGTPGDPITKPCDIARHILLEAGESVNAAAGTLGNFDDARASGGVLNVIDETAIAFGPQDVKVKDALRLLTEKFPMNLIKEDGVWNCIPDDLNPHSSRSYRSSSDEVWIGPDDIDPNDFNVDLLPWEAIQNSVAFKYSHGYPDREAAATYLYDNPISQMYYTKRETLPIEEPCIFKAELATSAVDSAPQTMAEWLGRRNGRRRLVVTAGLTQKFYDLKVGHVLEFRGLEDVGMKPFAPRNGLADYLFQSSSLSTNYGNSAAPLFIAGSGTNKMYMGFSQQVDRFIFPVSVAAAYTTVGAGDGSTAFSYMGLGAALTALTGVTNGNGLKSTGLQIVPFTRPAGHLVYKQEVSFGGVLAGPCYWYTMDYASATATGTGSARISCANVWAGRRFICVKVIYPAASKGKYPKRRFVFQEVM